MFQCMRICLTFKDCVLVQNYERLYALKINKVPFYGRPSDCNGYDYS